MARNHLFTAKVWQQPRVRQLRQALSVNRLYRQLSAGARRLPDYIIAGAQKSGTTSLWAYLNDHPLVKPAQKKEMNFFDNNFARGVDWYRRNFPLGAAEDSYEWSDPRTLTGESCANYMFHPLAPQRIAATIPHAKIILLLRNPVNRAFSHYQLKLRRRQETLSFEEAIDAEPERLNGEEQKLTADTTYYSPAHDRHSYLARGCYVDQIQHIERHFWPEQILILEAGELFHDTAAVYHRVLVFLGLPRHELPSFGNRFPGKYQETMSPAMRRRLVDYFAPHNERLYEHLGRRFDWDK